MFDIRLIRQDKEGVRQGLAAKGVSVDLDALLAWDEALREERARLEALRHRKNQANDEIGRLIKEGKDPQETIASMKEVAREMDEREERVRSWQQRIQETLIGLPNLPHASVPVGGEDQNQVVRTWGEKPSLNFCPKDHVAIAEGLDIIDFKRATKVTGSHFILFKGDGARLERALFNFMLDLHGREHGYREIFPPVVVNRDSMVGTGQLPKMEEDMYRLTDEELFLIPTAEVPVTNIHRNEVLAKKDLPIYYTAYTPCFRREAGSYGKDTRGLIRVHQFDKVEMVKFVEPRNSYAELDSLLANAEEVLRRLALPYRVVLLASGDLSFAAAKCYDLEVYVSGSDKWLEVSSCSNFESFQARRANIRFKDPETKKTEFVHTLNGSGLALARTMVAILENYQTESGEVVIPEVLRPYMGGEERIKKP